jgi:hypothetical protein
MKEGERKERGADAQPEIRDDVRRERGRGREGLVESKESREREGGGARAPSGEQGEREGGREGLVESVWRA